MCSFRIKYCDTFVSSLLQLLSWSQSFPTPLIGSCLLTTWTRPWCIHALTSSGSSTSTSPGSWGEHAPCQNPPSRKPKRSLQTTTSMWAGWSPAGRWAVKKCCEQRHGNTNSNHSIMLLSTEGGKLSECLFASMNLRLIIYSDCFQQDKLN